jgi:hypothetical protein
MENPVRPHLPLALLLSASPALAAITAQQTPGAAPAFDILSATVSRAGDNLTFAMKVSGQAGADIPAATGALAGAPVWSYVWPTSLDPATIGFEGGSGILALAATAHPDFDDTPLYDEDGDGDKANDGAGWHSHWVVLTPNEDCGPGALSVRDIPEGTTPDLPETWPGLPLFIDSPDIRPAIDGKTIALTLSLPRGADSAALKFDGVTSALRVNQSVHAPLLCVTDVWDVASGDLSLPGTVE